MKETAMAAALKEAGISPRLAALNKACALFLNQGGTSDEWQRQRVVVDEYFSRMLNGDHAKVAQSGQGKAYPVQQPIPDRGQVQGANDGHPTHAPVGNPNQSEGQLGFAHTGLSLSAPTLSPIASEASESMAQKPIVATPARDPSAGFIQASIAANREIAKSILYRVKTSDHRWWGDVHPYEIEGMHRDSLRGKALLAACGALNTKQMRMPFRDLLSDTKATVAMNRANKELSHVA